jgi:hypothetical protein
MNNFIPLIYDISVIYKLTRNISKKYRTNANYNRHNALKFVYFHINLENMYPKCYWI